MFYFTKDAIKLCVISCNYSVTRLYGDVNANRTCLYLPPFDVFILISNPESVKITTADNYISTVSE